MAKCVRNFYPDAAIRKEMVAPGLVASLTPIAVGIGGNYRFPGSGAVLC